MGFEVLKLLKEFGTVKELAANEEEGQEEDEEPVTVVDYRYSTCIHYIIPHDEMKNAVIIIIIVTCLFVCRKMIEASNN